MDDAAIVRRMNHLGEALEERHELVERHRPVCGQPLLERDAVDQLGREPLQAGFTVEPDVVDVRRVGMLELRHRHVALQRGFIGLLVQHPDDHVSLEEPLLPPIRLLGSS